MRSGDVVCDTSNVSALHAITVHLSYAKYPDDQSLVQMGGNASASTGLATLPTYGTPIVIAGGAGPLQGGPLPSGVTAQVTLTGPQPSSAVHIVVHSAVVDLGWVKADRAGRLNYRFRVPATLAPGAHELHFVTGHGTLMVRFAVARRRAAMTVATTARTVAARRPVTLSTRVTNRATRTAARLVVVQLLSCRTRAGRYRVVRRLRTTTAGVARLRLHPTRTAWYRWHPARSASFVAASSAAVKVAVRG